MRIVSPPVVLVLAGVGLSACVQDDQTLPFEAAPPEVAQRTIGPSGGLISHPAGISIRFPSGAVASPVTVTVFAGQSLDEFPGAPEGTLIDGTYFNVSPNNLDLLREAEIDLAIDPDLLDEADLVRVGLASSSDGDGLASAGVNYDLTSGILHARLSKLGAVVAVVSDNAVPVDSRTPPVLGGGTFETNFGPAQNDAPSLVSSAPTTFTVECGHSGQIRRCVRSGTIQIWASSEIQERLSGDMVILNPAVAGSLEFTDFVNGFPTRAIGSLSVTGTLRVQLGQAITSYEVNDTYRTNGIGGSSSVSFSGNSFTLGNTTDGARAVEYAIQRSGTGQRLVVRGEETVDLENEDGSTTTGRLFIDLRLRR